VVLKKMVKLLLRAFCNRVLLAGVPFMNDYRMRFNLIMSRSIRLRDDQLFKA